jgi:alkylation response protein AidB-like acyl-CoA dehydrogenase
MDFHESEEIQALRDTLRKFIARECPQDLVNQWDREDLISRDMAQKLGELGVFGMCVPEEYGGLGRQVTGLVVVTEELARCSMALGGIYHMGASYCALNIAESGSEEQKQRILPLALEGKMLFAYGLSEPDTGATLPMSKPAPNARAIASSSTASSAGPRAPTLPTTSMRWCAAARPKPNAQNLSFVLIPDPGQGRFHHPTRRHGRTLCTALTDVALDNVEISIDDVIGGEAAWNKAGTSLPALRWK